MGKEKLQGKKADKTKSKACAALRPVKEHVDRNLASVNAAKRAKHEEAAAQELVSLGKKKPPFPNKVKPSLSSFKPLLSAARRRTP